MLNKLTDPKQLHSACKALTKVKAQTVDEMCGKAFKKPQDLLLADVLALNLLISLHSDAALTEQGYDPEILKYIYRRYNQIFFSKYFARHKN